MRYVGTCSWKYPSWQGLVYSQAKGIDYLAEYARHYDTVEVDQWFWSLQGKDKVALPRVQTVREYAASVPATFRFAVKLPNSLTLTHGYRPKKSGPLVPNPHFLSTELLGSFLETLVPLRGKLGPLMLQFGYLNQHMMRSQDEFLARLEEFAVAWPEGLQLAVEVRNANYLNRRYFELLQKHNVAHVFLQGYYMPPVEEIYSEAAGLLADTAVVRLHGPDRAAIEKRTGKQWNKVVDPRDEELASIARVLRDLEARDRNAWVFANNHFEGCAPETITRLGKVFKALPAPQRVDANGG